MTLEKHINKALKGLFVDGDKDNSWGTDEKTKEIMNLIYISNIKVSPNLKIDENKNWKCGKCLEINLSRWNNCPTCGNKKQCNHEGDKNNFHPQFCTKCGEEFMYDRLNTSNVFLEEKIKNILTANWSNGMIPFKYEGTDGKLRWRIEKLLELFNN